MFVKLAHFINIMLLVLVAGVMWGTWLALGRTMTEYDVTTFLADGQHMIDNLATVMAVLMIAAVVLGLIVVGLLFRRWDRGSAWLALASLVLMLGVLAVTLLVEVPIDNEIKVWTPQTVPPDWADMRARWADFHTFRTFLSLAAVAAAVAAALASRPVATRTADQEFAAVGSRHLDQDRHGEPAH